jgi:hypothetical protein
MPGKLRPQDFQGDGAIGTRILSLRQDNLGREDDNGLKPFVGAL